MSVEMISWALKTPLSGAQKLVLIGLANHATAEGDNARPAVGTLAVYAGIHKRNVRRTLRALEEQGWIETTGVFVPPNGRQDRAVNVYRLRDPERGGAGAPPTFERGGAEGPSGGALAPPEPSRENRPVTANAVTISKNARVRDEKPDQPSLNEAFEERVEKFLDVHGGRVVEREPTMQRPTKTAAAREAARAILRREPDAISVLRRLDWALHHPYWAAKVRTMVGFNRGWADLSLQWRGAMEQAAQRAERERESRRRFEPSEVGPQPSVRYDGERLEIVHDGSC